MKIKIKILWRKYGIQSFRRNLLHKKEHIWVKIEGDVATIGITDYGQHQLGDIVFIDMPEKDRS